MWYFYLETSKINLSVLLRKWEVFYWMEKNECGSSSQERWQANIKTLPTNIVTSYFWQDLQKIIVWQDIWDFHRKYPDIYKISQVLNHVILVLINFFHDIYQSFDDSLEVRAIFLDISKAFDKVWHKGLILKLKQKCISDKILNIITDFLTFRKQRVFLNGQVSPWSSIGAGVLQDSILGPLLFLILHYLPIWQSISYC